MVKDCQIRYLETSHRSYCAKHQRDEIECVKLERDALKVQVESLIHEVAGTKAFLERLAIVSIPTFSEEAARLLEYMHTGVSEKPRICEDCGKQDASVTRACFKPGRFYLCHDCDR